MSYSEYVPLIKGEVSDHFPDAVRWGIASPINYRSESWRCAYCGCNDRLLVLGRDAVLFNDCIACWLGCDRQLSLLAGGLMEGSHEQA